MFPCATEPTRSSLKFAFLFRNGFSFPLYSRTGEGISIDELWAIYFFNIVCSPKSSIEVAAVDGWPDPHLLSPNADTFYEPDS